RHFASARTPRPRHGRPRIAEGFAMSPRGLPMSARPRFPSPGRPLRVLVAEDDDDTARSTALLLRLWGYEARTAADGPAALRAAAGAWADVILLDLGLPGVDGYEVARRLRRRPGGLPLLVAVSGYGEAADRRRSREAGIHVHLTKPANLGWLHDLLEGLRAV